MATELWLKYTDATGETKRVLVEGEKFVVGRHSENDLSIPESSLSRKHVKIERFGDVFVVSDLKSSNGTKLNETELKEPAALKKGDRLNLGGGVELEAEIISDEEDFGASRTAADEESMRQAEIAAQVSGADVVASSGASGGGSSIPMSFFILAPLLGFCFLGLIGGGIYIFSGDGEISKNRDSNFIYSGTSSPTPPPERTIDEADETPTPKTSPTGKPSETPANSGGSSNSEPPPTPPPPAGDADKIERHALAFTRRIAINDNNYVFSRAQIGEIGSRVKSFSGSSALRENLRAVRQNAAQFEQMAQTKGLKPQFLAVAALARLGNNRGNPLATAQEMLPVLGELKISLGNELADDNLLIIAAFEQGTRGEFRAMRNTVEVLSKESGVDAGRARSVWYVRQKGKLSDAQYEFVLRFLAIGAVSQNPKDFNVETEALTFN